jgi:sugar-1,4-lactone oxidase-like protein
LVEVRAGLVSNWARNQSCRPKRFTYPETVEELQASIAEAAEQGLRVRVIGGGHSWSAAAMTDDWLISLDGLNRVIAVDSTEGTVTVEAGIRLTDLNRELDAHGLALSNLGSVSVQSIAGATSTGTHGSHGDRPILAGMVRALELVTATGEIRRVDRVKDAEVFRAVGVGLGVFGVIARMTVDVVPAFNLEERVVSLPFDRAAADMLSMVDASEFVKFWWLPHTGRVQVFTYTPTSKPPNASRTAAWLDRVLVNRLGLPAMLTLGELFPQMIPAINKAVGMAYLSRAPVVKRSHEAFNVAMPARHLEVEYALPSELAPEALRLMREVIEGRGIHVNFVQEIRFAKGDDFLLSPASGRDTCFVGAYVAGSIQERQYLRGFEERMIDLGGRPHWGKDFTVESKYLRQVYPGFEAFLELRNTWDPEGRFLSPFAARVLGLSEPDR